MCWFTPQKPTKCGLGPGAKVGAENAIQIFSVGCGNPVHLEQAFWHCSQDAGPHPTSLGFGACLCSLIATSC